MVSPLPQARGELPLLPSLGEEQARGAPSSVHPTLSLQFSQVSTVFQLQDHRWLPGYPSPSAPFL